MDKLRLEIVTPDGMIFSNDVNSLTLPGKEGEFGVLPGHAALITLLGTGVIEISCLDNSKELVAINWGYVKVDENSVSVLADGAVYIGGNEDGELSQALKKAQELIKSMGSDDAALASAMAKIDSLKRK